MHEKPVIIDDKIVWMGSLNTLGFAGNTGEIMTELDSLKFLIYRDTDVVSEKYRSAIPKRSLDPGRGYGESNDIITIPRSSIGEMPVPKKKMDTKNEAVISMDTKLKGERKMFLARFGKDMSLFMTMV